MDGTPAAYYFRAASTQEASNTWIVFLEAGGWCTDKVACQARWDGSTNGWAVESNANLVSSRNWTDTQTRDGLFDADDPVLKNANKVFLEYCTSDAHMGNTTGENFYDADVASSPISTWGWTDNGVFKPWEFRGHEVVRSMFDHLVKQRRLGTYDNTVLLFGGSSAGSRGAMIHLDYVPEFLGSAAARRTTVYGFLDSPMHLDHASVRADGWSQCEYHESCYPQSWVPGRAETARRAYYNFKIQHIGTSCAAAFTGTEAWGSENGNDQSKLIDRQWRCVMGHHRTKYISTPFTVVASQYDTYLLRHDVGCVTDAEIYYSGSTTGCDLNEYRLLWAAEAANLTRTLMEALPSHASTLSWSCTDHAGALGDNNFNHKYGAVYGENMNWAITNMLAGNVTRSVDPCNGWACSIGCSGLQIFPPPPPAPASWGTYVGEGKCRHSGASFANWNLASTTAATVEDCIEFAMSYTDYRGYAYAFSIAEGETDYQKCWAYYEKSSGGYPTETATSAGFVCYSLEGVYHSPPPPSLPPVPAVPPPPSTPVQWGLYIGNGKCRHTGGSFSNWGLNSVTGITSMDGCVAYAMNLNANYRGYAYAIDITDSSSDDYQRCWGYYDTNNGGWPVTVAEVAGWVCYSLENNFFPPPPPLLPPPPSLPPYPPPTPPPPSPPALPPNPPSPPPYPPKSLLTAGDGCFVIGNNPVECCNSIDARDGYYGNSPCNPYGTACQPERYLEDNGYAITDCHVIYATYKPPSTPPSPPALPPYPPKTALADGTGCYTIGDPITCCNSIDGRSGTSYGGNHCRVKLTSEGAYSACEPESYLESQGTLSASPDCHDVYETYRPPPSAPPPATYQICSNVYSDAAECERVWDTYTKNQQYNGYCSSHFNWAYTDGASAAQGDIDAACTQFAAGNSECGACGPNWYSYNNCTNAPNCTATQWYTDVTDTNGNTNTCAERIKYVYDNQGSYSGVTTIEDACQHVATDSAQGTDTVCGGCSTVSPPSPPAPPPVGTQCYDCSSSSDCATGYRCSDNECILDGTGTSGTVPSTLSPGGYSCRDNLDCQSGVCIWWLGSGHRNYCAAFPGNDSPCSMALTYDNVPGYCFYDSGDTVSCGDFTECISNVCRTKSPPPSPPPSPPSPPRIPTYHSQQYDDWSCPSSYTHVRTKSECEALAPTYTCYGSPCPFMDFATTSNFAHIGAYSLDYTLSNVQTGVRCASTRDLIGGTSTANAHGPNVQDACSIEVSWDANNNAYCSGSTDWSGGTTTKTISISRDGTSCTCSTDACSSTTAATTSSGALYDTYTIVSSVDKIPVCAHFHYWDYSTSAYYGVIGWADLYRYQSASGTRYGDVQSASGSDFWYGIVCRDPLAPMPTPPPPMPPPAPPFPPPAPTYYCRYDDNWGGDLCCAPGGGYENYVACAASLSSLPQCGGGVSGDCYYLTYTATCLQNAACQ